MADSLANSGSRANYLMPFHWREALLCAPAMPLLIVAGLLADRPVAGAIAAGAAFAVGFGAARELKGRRWGAMIAAMFGMSLAAFAGCLLGQSLVLFLPVAAVAAALCAGTALRDEDLWWVVLQVVIAFLVAGYYPGPLVAAAERAVAVLVGGAVQIGVVMVLARLFPAAAAPTISGASPDTHAGLRRAHMVRAALCVVASLVAARWLGLSNSYWAAMTALLVLKPHLRETRIRGFTRLGGTIAGCGVATLYAWCCHDYALPLGAGMVIAATAAYGLQKAHYAALTTAITATVVLLLTLGHSGVLSNAEHRFAATLLGGTIALFVAWVFPSRPGPRFTVVDRVGS